MGSLLLQCLGCLIMALALICISAGGANSKNIIMEIKRL